MKKTLVLAAAAVMTATGLVNGATYTAVQSGAWNSPATWGQSVNYPMPGDTAIISSDVLVTVSADGGADVLQVSSGGAVTVNSGRTLTIQSGFFNSPLDTFQVDGTVVLDSGTFEVDAGQIYVDGAAKFIMQGADPRLQIDVANGFILSDELSMLEVDANAAIGGSGSLQGLHPDAYVVINGLATDEDIQLTIEPSFIVHGTLSFVGNADEEMGGKARLDNNGLIKVDVSNSYILLDASLYAITDGGSCGTTNWWANSGQLRFEQGTTALGGSFQVDSTLVVDGVTVTTNGRRLGSGTTSLPNGGAFNYAMSCP